MSNDKKERRGVFGQIFVAVVIALLVGGTAPWWWKVLFPEKHAEPREPTATQQPRDAPRQPQAAPQQPESPPASTPESLSRTEYSLPGDAIVHFRVVEIRGRELSLDVDYRVNAQHGEKVMVGARLKGVSSGYTPTYVPTRQEGTARLQMSANEAGTSSDIEIFLYEWGRPAEPLARRTFPYQMRFE
jgi:cytoskeletal protein RodZ